jgi:hypothetical protein
MLPCTHGMARRTPVLDDDELPLIFGIYLDHKLGHRHMTVGHIPAPYVGPLVLAEYVGSCFYLHKSNNLIMLACPCMSARHHGQCQLGLDSQCRPGPMPVNFIWVNSGASSGGRAGRWPRCSSSEVICATTTTTTTPSVRKYKMF